MSNSMTDIVIQTLHAAMEGLTYRQIAKQAGIRPATISDLVNRKKSPRLETVEKIITACEELKQTG